LQYVNNLPPSVFQAFYPSKLLLFGEHTVLQGSQALAMPLSKFGGKWAFSDDRALQYNLSEFNAYLKELVKNTDLKLDTSAFGDALNQGLIFQSNIPSGYGVGSSGALVAAIYTTFCSKKTENLLDLKTILGKMESFFHGASSGLDPLICYLQKPVLINKGGSMEIVDIPKSNISPFLIDTKITRKAGNLIKIFAEKCEQEYYKNLVINDLVPNINDAIAAFLQNQKTILFEAIHHISFFQHRFFPEAIPLPFKQIWLEGLASDNYKLKLCGAGGGGFILGFSKNITETRVILKRFGFDMIAL
jgi:mevalonate kinase